MKEFTYNKGFLSRRKKCRICKEPMKDGDIYLAWSYSHHDISHKKCHKAEMKSIVLGIKAMREFEENEKRAELREIANILKEELFK